MAKQRRKVLKNKIKVEQSGEKKKNEMEPKKIRGCRKGRLDRKNCPARNQEYRTGKETDGSQ
jgi:hypothetical protein